MKNHTLIANPEMVNQPDGIYIYGESTEKAILRIYPNENAEANANLIAVSPELLKCAEMLLNLCNNWEINRVHDIKYFEELNHNLTANKAMIEYALNAINKATK